MKKKLFIYLFSFLALPFVRAQVISETFEDVNYLMNNGWETKNLSSPRGLGVWYQDMGNFVSHSGSTLSTIIADFTTIPEDKSGTISCWLFTPELFFGSNDSISFWANSFNGNYYANKLEVRISTSGSSTHVGSDENSVGDFGTLLYTINPNFDQYGFPPQWIQHKIKLPIGTITGLSGRLAFRYVVTDGGPLGHNGSTIGIDDFNYYTNETVSTSELSAFQVHIFPNPVDATATLNIQLPDDNLYNVSIFSMNGTNVYSRENIAQFDKINIEKWAQGMYVIKVTNAKHSLLVSKKIIIQ